MRYLSDLFLLIKYAIMGSSKDRCCCCGVRGDKTKYALYLVHSSSLIARLNRLNPNQEVLEGMPVCKNCRKQAENIVVGKKNTELSILIASLGIEIHFPCYIRSKRKQCSSFLLKS